MDKLHVFFQEFKKRSKELNIDNKTCQIVTDIYNSIEKDNTVNYLDTYPSVFMLDSYSVLRHHFDKSMPLYNQGIFVTTFNTLRKSLGLPTTNTKIHNISYIEWHLVAKITYNNFNGVYVGIPIVIKYTGDFKIDDMEWTILSFDNRAIKIVDLITIRNPTIKDMIIR